MTCRVCGEPGAIRCKACIDTLLLVKKSEPGSLVLVVDGSYRPRPGRMGYAGAGLVLATAHDEAVVAYCAPAFYARDSHDTEMEAVRRGLMWAPLEVAWTDCESLIPKMNGRALFIPPEMREPLHNFAHHLSYAASHRDQDRLSRIWVPGAVW